MLPKLAVITTHPIQYYAPLFKLLASNPAINVKVFYTLGVSFAEVKDEGFGINIDWDIPLLDGYAYQYLDNISKTPGTSSFWGIINPCIIEEISAFAPTDLLVFGWSFQSHLKVLRHFKNKVNIYFRGDSTLLDEEKGVKVLIRRIVLTWIYKHIDKAFYVGTNNKQYFLKHGLKKTNLVFAPHAVDNERFGDDIRYDRIAKELKVELEISEQDIVFLFTGKFSRKKNPLLLIKAFKKTNLAKTHLLLVGNGEMEEDLKQESEGYTNIHFLPFQNQSQMPAVYRVADVLVLPSSGPGETWGLCINEAMASGRAIIASDRVGSAIDLVHENKNGYVFDAKRTESLVEKLSKCASKSKKELYEMGQSSKAIIANWSYRHICQVILSTVVGEAYKQEK